MSIPSNIAKRRRLRLLARRKINYKKKMRLPGQYYHALKHLAGTAEFAALVAKRGSVREAIFASEWYAEASHHQNFNASQCEIWIRRMSKSWQNQQTKRIKAEWSAVKIRCPKPEKIKPRTKKKSLPDKSRFLQALLKDDGFYAVSSRSLSSFVLRQYLLNLRDSADDFGQWHGLSQLIQAKKKVRIITKIFIGRITNGRFNLCRGRFDWPTEFTGVVIEVRFEAEGLKSRWKIKLVTDDCRLVRGWDRHFLLRMDRLDQLGSRVAEQLKKCGKTHLLQKLGLTRRAA